MRDSCILQGVQLPCVCAHSSATIHGQKTIHADTRRVGPSATAVHNKKPAMLFVKAKADARPSLPDTVLSSATTETDAPACCACLHTTLLPAGLPTHAGRSRDHRVCPRRKLTVTRGLSANICRPVGLSRMRCRIACTAESPNVSPTRPTQSPRAGLQRWSSVSGVCLAWVAGNVAAGEIQPTTHLSRAPSAESPATAPFCTMLRGT